MKKFSLLLTLSSFLNCSFLFADEYKIENNWINLADGTRLAVTYYLPETQAPDANFPVLLEMLPYRKDDLSKAWAHPLYDYFASQGIAMAKVDVRGTGSSFGETPTREYSKQEIDDAVEIIASLAKMPWSNGNVGMWGISWGGFNALQVALRKPPELKAVLAAHASDDLFKNDVHYTDGIFSIDEYILSINHMTGFMQSPDYNVDEDYFSSRFDREPWLFETMRNGVNNSFWQGGSLLGQYGNLDIPVYLIGGLFDGYRDTLPHLLENADVPVRAVLGPWPHAWPNSASPGPTWEWRDDAADWWQHWLGSTPVGNPEFETNSFRFFQRSGGAAATVESDDLPGQWFTAKWPIESEKADSLVLYPSENNTLSSDPIPNQATEISLNRIASLGIELGEWWGELLGDMQVIDNESLVFDSQVLEAPAALLGQAQVNLLAASDASDGHWVVRLEDVSPDGDVTLVTGGAINGHMRESSSKPQKLQASKFYPLQIPLRMSTWTFQPGHRIRLAVSNGAFPMFWPSAKLRSSQLKIDSNETRLELPLVFLDDLTEVPMSKGGSSSYLPAQLISMQAIESFPGKREVIKSEEAGTVDFIRESGVRYVLENAELEATRHTSHQANIGEPALTHFKGWAEYALKKTESEGTTFRYRTDIDLKSDEAHFTLEASRTLLKDDEEIRSRHWEMSLPRGAH